jgi:hypothetical protein
MQNTDSLINQKNYLFCPLTRLVLVIPQRKLNLVQFNLELLGNSEILTQSNNTSKLIFNNSKVLLFLCRNFVLKAANEDIKTNKGIINYQFNRILFANLWRF